MRHTDTAVSRAVRDRMACTAEPYRQALTAVRALTPDEALIPRALSEHQRRLELGLLLTVPDAADTAFWIDRPDAFTGDPVFASVRPYPDHLSIRLNEPCVVPYLAGLLASETLVGRPAPTFLDDHGITRGVWGLRLKLEQGRFVARLLDEQSRLTDARVVFDNVRQADERRIRSAVAKLQEGFGGGQLLYDDAPRLSRTESESYELYWSLAGSGELGSAMLRRIGLLGRTANVWSADSGQSLNISLEESPPAMEVERAMRHPRTGIVGERYVINRSDATGVRILDTRAGSVLNLYVLEVSS